MHADQWLLQASKPTDFATDMSASLRLQHTLHQVRVKKADHPRSRPDCPIKSEHKQPAVEVAASGQPGIILGFSLN